LKKQYQQLQDNLFTTKQEASNDLHLIRKEKNQLAQKVQELNAKNLDLLKDKENLTNSLTQQEQQNQTLSTDKEELLKKLTEQENINQS